ncbi:MAG: c-type cytochrome, partial [Akkermansiaceae bacterium]
MKSLLIPFFLLSPVFAQVTPPTSIPLEETKSPFTSGDTLSNSRLFLNYSAEKSPTIHFGDHPVALPSGENISADLTFEHGHNHPATIHLRTSSDPSAQVITIPDSTISGSPANFQPLPGKDFPMDQTFTLMVRFQTTAEDGTLAARAPATGKWQPKGKTLFLRNGQLHYDIGWVGELKGGPQVNDGKEHLAALTSTGDGKVHLYLDGKKIAAAEKLTAKDDPTHLFKIGSTATDFAGNFKDGTISQVLFWKRNLSPQEIKTEVAQLNTPDFHWKNKKPSQSHPSHPSAVKNPFKTQVTLPKNLTLHQAWTQPLQTSDHQAIISTWNSDSLQRGKKIYQQLCITCHGDETKEGSIPLSLKFHSGTFKNGADPYRMFQTLTKGYGMMMPMPQFTTRQKYDVIHYIREQFLAEKNPTQLTKITDTYLRDLPRGLTLVQEKETPETIPPYKQMDFGNVLFGTYQIEPGPIDKDVNIAQKGIAIRLDPGPGGISKGKAWAVYDHDTMRLAALYTCDQFVDWKGIDFDGSHGTHTSIVG